MTSPWTDERVERLKSYWADGYSVRAIAVALGGMTRNAVIGKVHRLGLSAHICRAAPEVERRARKARDQGKTPVPGPSVVCLPERAPDPTPRFLKLAELTKHTCKWPIGDPRAPEFVFCGSAKNIDRPYCPHHQSIAYQVMSR